MDYKLRPWRMSDLENLVTFANNVDIARFLTDAFPHPYTKESGIAFIESANKDNPVHIFAIEVDGKAVGGIGIHPQHDIQRKNAELGYWLAQPYWNKGIMTKAVVEMLEFGFSHYDIDRIFARPFGHNIASQKVLEKSGFQLEALLKGTLIKNGEKVDELIYSVRR